MNALQELLAKKPEQTSTGTGLKAKEQDFNLDMETGVATLTADFDINDIIRNGKSTSSGKERFANCTIRIAGTPIRFTGNCFVKIS